MKETLELILTKILGPNAKFEIEIVPTANGHNMIIDVAEEFRPRLIGKGGRTIKSIHNLVNIVAKKEGERVFVRLKD